MTNVIRGDDYDYWIHCPLSAKQWVSVRLEDRAALRHDELDALIEYLCLVRTHLGRELQEKSAKQDLERLDKRAGDLFEFHPRLVA